MASYIWPPNGAGGVTSIDGLTGAVLLVAGPGITITDNSPIAGDITIAATTAGLFTQGSVIFAGPTGALAQDNAKFFWDDTNFRLGIGTAAPGSSLHVTGTGASVVGTFENTDTVTTSAAAFFRFLVNSSGTSTVTGLLQAVSSQGTGTALFNQPLSFVVRDLVNGPIVILASGASGIIQLATGGTTLSNERMRITSAGLVGVNTTAPASQLEVDSSSTSQIGIISKNKAAQTASNFQAQDSNGTAYVTIGPDVLPGNDATINFLNVTGTLPASISAATSGVAINITGAGTSSSQNKALTLTYAAGYTGSNTCLGADLANLNAGTGTNVWAGGAGNYGARLGMTATTAGNNIGFRCTASGSSSLNVGFLAAAISATNTPPLNIGGGGIALNGTVNVGGFFGLMTTTPTFTTSAAIVLDNGAVAAPILVARVNTVNTTVIDATGQVGILNASPSRALDVTGSIGATNQLISTVATGTAPIVVSSTTLVPNLHVATADALSTPPTASNQLTNLGLSISAAAGVITVALKQADGSTNPGAGTGAVVVGFRDPTSTVGAYNARSMTAALSLTLAGATTLGVPDSVVSVIYVYLFDNAGTVTLGASALAFDEGMVQSSSTSTTSNQIIYQASALSSKPIRIIGRFTATNTSGSWGSPATVSLKPFQEQTIQAGYTTSNTSIGSSTTVLWATKVQDPYNMYSSGTFTAPKAGIYLVQANIELNSATYLSARVTLQVVAGSTFEIARQEFPVSVTESLTLGGSVVITDVTANQGISINILQNTGGNIALNNSASDNFVSIIYLGPRI